MGLFDMFSSDAGEVMTPHKAFAISLLYCMAADGEMDNEEVGHLLSVLGGSEEKGVIGVGAQNRKLLDSAMKYMRSHSTDQFLNEAAPILSDAQKMCILTNLVDSSLSDGEAEREEQVFIEKAMRAFGIDENRFRPFFEVIVLKNDRNVFTNPDNPKNSPDYQVKLST